ncbi:AI-2E family transporter [Mycolicibacterium flavescens]|uniref:AI-2E family transporter n=1 Tax=Mycolicibacterium flavescens TaxID=1776 RepID=A0A1E3RJW3_MYCFV|nr:AI-2E family transporter [Mycolicibacterium flavescens]MCV7282517.1 AI-2E family transporter [Mycolicibacterium flavescens]ODQ90148.1 AI-2E family transporter [Mycolicibacterium flavescens]
MDPVRARAALYGAAKISAWSLVVAAAAVAVLWLIGALWMAAWPIIIALLLTTLTWPVARFLRGHRWPAAAAALTVTAGFLLLVFGVAALIAIPVGAQAGLVAEGVARGLQTLQDWAQGPPLNLDNDQLDSVVDAVVNQVQSSASDIAGVVVGGVGTVVSGVVTAVLSVVLLFFFLKDGPRFLPWARNNLPGASAVHVPELLSRGYDVLGRFVRSQALIGFIDAAFIGLGLLIVGVPLVLPLSVLIFVGAFVPIVGAFVAGAVAVLIALVSNGFVNALIVLAIIVVVQQLEGNLLQPVVQGKGLHVHPAVILLGVVVGGQLAGVVGALLASPVAALIAVVWRYLRDQLSVPPEDPVIDG